MKYLGPMLRFGTSLVVELKQRLVWEMAWDNKASSMNQLMCIVAHVCMCSWQKMTFSAF